MKGKGRALSPGDAVRVGRAVTHVESTSRETTNVTAGQQGLPNYNSGQYARTAQGAEPVLWPVEVTGAALSSPASLAGLYPGLLYVADFTATPPWRTEDCWVLPLPATTLDVGETGMAKLVDWRAADGVYTDPRPVYALVGAGSGAADCGPGCGWVAGLDDTDCLQLSVISGIANQLVSLAWLTDAWTSDPWTLTVPTNSGVVEFWVEGPVPHLSVNGLELVLDCCGVGPDGRPYAVFSGGPATGHDDNPTTECELRTFRVKVECWCCPNADWTHEPGWWCVVASGMDCGTGQVVCADYTHSIPCTDVILCEGPWADQETCQALCTAPPTEGGYVTCCSRNLAATLYVSLSGGNGTVTINWNGVAGYWEGDAALPCGEHVYFRYLTSCSLLFSCSGVAFVGATRLIPATSCGPPLSDGNWIVNLDNLGAGCAFGSCGTLNATVSE